jgi:tetratricopeptide (TPR) repeat protein
MGKYNEALSEYNKALYLKPDYAEAYVAIGNIYVYDKTKKDDDKALELFQKALSIKKKYPYAWVCIGDVYYRRGENEKALEAYQKSRDEQNDYFWAWNGIGNILFGMERRFDIDGKWDDAIEAFKKTVVIKPDFPWAYLKLAQIYAIKSDRPNMLVNLKRAIELNPTFKKDIFKKDGELLDEFKKYREDPEFKAIIS